MKWRRLFLTVSGMILAVWLCVILGGGNPTEDARLRIGATYMTMNNPFYSVIDEELRLMIESRGDILLTRDPALDQDKQNDQIHALLAADIDLLVINPVDYQQIQPSLEEARAADVPVVIVDSQVSDPSLVTCTIASDNYGAGVLCAEHLMRTRDSAHIALLEHPSAQSGVDRIQGFCDTIAAYPQYQIAGRASSDGQLELAMPAMDKLLQTDPSINVVMSLNDPTALGAMAALQDRHLLDQTLVYGVDGAPEAKSMIVEGAMTATVAQSPIQIGQATAQVIYQILSDEDYPTEIIVPVELITEENASQFGVNGWQ
ncbi:MAG TPA: sugar ABC transporter substrate-binding protein [Candidatus Agathobaculum intestinipullorum]|nr:sugar ABC transporter substrate-binding protein [Candidatus Agathobaculum intestinipullorum]